MNLTTFYLVIDFVISNIMQFFAVCDTVVIVDDPRFSFFNFLVSVIFVGLLVKTINWLRGVPMNSNRSRLNIIRGRKDDLKEYPRENSAFMDDFEYRKAVGKLEDQQMIEHREHLRRY